MSHPRRARPRKAPNISELEWAFLNDALDEDDPRRQEPGLGWRFYELFSNSSLDGGNRRIVDDLWRAYGRTVLARWLAEKPGTRPSLWWVYDAPRVRPGTFQVFGGDELPEPRRRKGGIGTPLHEVSAYYPRFSCGIPVDWVTEPEPRPVGLMASPGGYEERQRAWLEGDAIDPDDPPLYDAQALYLERHGLLLPGERERLTAKDFEPEAVICRHVSHV